MSRVVDRKLWAYAVLLRTVMAEPRRWNDINKTCLELSPWQLQTGLAWLLRCGYIEKRGKGLYAITRRGLTLYEALRRDP